MARSTIPAASAGWPDLIVDPELRLVPWFLRIPGKLNRVTESLRMRAA